MAGGTWSYGAGGEDFWLVKVSAPKPEYHLTATAIPLEGGSVTLDPPGRTYDEGTEVTVTAEPIEGYEFDCWTGDYPESQEYNTQITVIMDSDKSLTAHFKIKARAEFPWTLIVGVGVAIVVIAGVNTLPEETT